MALESEDEHAEPVEHAILVSVIIIFSALKSGKVIFKFPSKRFFLSPFKIKFGKMFFNPFSKTELNFLYTHYQFYSYYLLYHMLYQTYNVMNW